MSGLANVRGTVTLELSTPLVGEAICKLAGGASYTLVENADDPTMQSVSFAGGGAGAGERASPAVMTADLLSGAVVENVDTGIAELQAPPGPATAANESARPDAPGASPVQVTLEN